MTDNPQSTLQPLLSEPVSPYDDDWTSWKRRLDQSSKCSKNDDNHSDVPIKKKKKRLRPFVPLNTALLVKNIQRIAREKDWNLHDLSVEVDINIRALLIAFEKSDIPWTMHNYRRKILYRKLARWMEVNCTGLDVPKGVATCSEDAVEEYSTEGDDLESLQSDIALTGTVDVPLASFKQYSPTVSTKNNNSNGEASDFFKNILERHQQKIVTMKQVEISPTPPRSTGVEKNVEEKGSIKTEAETTTNKQQDQPKVEKNNEKKEPKRETVEILLNPDYENEVKNLTVAKPRFEIPNAVTPGPVATKTPGYILFVEHINIYDNRNITAGSLPGLLFSDANLSVAHGKKYGIIGPSGSGSSLLLKYIARNPIFKQEVENSGASMAYIDMSNTSTSLNVQTLENTDLENISDDDLKLNVIDFVRNSRGQWKQLKAMESKLEQIVHNAPSNAAVEEALKKLRSVYVKLADLNSDNSKHKALQIVSGLGFTPSMLKIPVYQLSPKSRKVCQLARIIYAEPELLIVDQPSNLLSVDCVIWLSSYLKGKQLRHT